MVLQSNSFATIDFKSRTAILFTALALFIVSSFILSFCVGFYFSQFLRSILNALLYCTSAIKQDFRFSNILNIIVKCIYSTIKYIDNLIDKWVLDGIEKVQQSIKVLALLENNFKSFRPLFKSRWLKRPKRFRRKLIKNLYHNLRSFIGLLRCLSYVFKSI